MCGCIKHKWFVIVTRTVVTLFHLAAHRQWGPASFFLCHWICTRDLMRFSCMVLSGFPNHSNGAEEIHDFGDICKYTQAKGELGKPGTHPTLETNKHTCMFKKLKFFDNFSRICPCIIISWWTLVIRSCFFLSHNSNLTRFFCFFIFLDLLKYFVLSCYVLLFLDKTNIFKIGAFTNSNHAVHSICLFLNSWKRFSFLIFCVFFSAYQFDKAIFYIMFLSHCTRLS